MGHETFLSLTEHKRLEKSAEDERSRAFEKAELEKYKAAEKAEQERIRTFEKSELERLQKSEAVAREVKRKEEIERLEKVEKELKIIRQGGGGGGKKMNYEDRSYGYGYGYGHAYEESDAEADEYQIAKRGKLRRRRSIMEEIDFIHAIGRKFHPPSTSASPQAATGQHEREKKDAERDAALNKLQSEFSSFKFDNAISKAKTEGLKEGMQNGEAKVMREIEFRKELEDDLLGRLGRGRDKTLRARRHRERSRSSSSERSRSRDGRVGRRRAHRERDRERARGGVDLEALANLPGRWNFAIESTEAAARQALPAPHTPNPVDPYPLADTFRDRELLRLGGRVDRLEDRHANPNPKEQRYHREEELYRAVPSKRNKEVEEEMQMRERVARLEEQQRFGEREKEIQRELEEKEWRERMLMGMGSGQSRLGGGGQADRRGGASGIDRLRMGR